MPDDDRLTMSSLDQSVSVAEAHSMALTRIASTSMFGVPRMPLPT